MSMSLSLNQHNISSSLLNKQCLIIEASLFFESAIKGPKADRIYPSYEKVTQTLEFKGMILTVAVTIIGFNKWRCLCILYVRR